MPPFDPFPISLLRRSDDSIPNSEADRNRENSSGSPPDTFHSSSVSDSSNSKTILILVIVGSGLGVLFMVALAFRYFRRFNQMSKPRKLSFKSDSSALEPSLHSRIQPDKCFGSTKLGSLSRAVRKPFRNSRSSFFNRHSTSENDKNGLKQLDSFDDLLWRSGGISNKLGLSEAELSQILATPPGNSSAPGTSADTQSTLPTDSWDQYMSILKHEEHLHFEDITPVSSTTHSSTDFSRHRHHPSLLSHYFHSTIGSLNLNRVEPLNGTKPVTSEEIELNGLQKHRNNSAYQQHFVNESTESLQQLLTTATVASGLPTSNPPASIKVPTPLVTPPSHNKEYFWSRASDNSQFTSSPTALAPFRRPSLEIKIVSPSPAKVNPSGWKSPHLADPGRLSALIETSPPAPEPPELQAPWDTASEHLASSQKV